MASAHALAPVRPAHPWATPIFVLLIAAATAAVIWEIVIPPRHHVAVVQEDESSAAPLTAEQQARLRVEPATLRDFVEPLVVPGRIVFDEERSAPVFSPQEGLVRAILARPGDHVEAGQPLAEIESGDVLEAESGYVEAVGGKAKAAAARLRAEHEAARAQRLYEAKAGSLKDLEEAQADLAEAVAEDDGADAELAAARRKLALIGLADADIDALARSRAVDRRAVLRAPIAGVVVSRKIAPGQWLKAEGDEPLFAVADPSRVWVMAQLPEVAAPLVRPGLEVEARVPALPERIFHAQVVWVAAAIDAETHRLPARCEVDNADGALKAGMAADLRIAQPSRRALAVPQAAVVRTGSQASVWIAKGDGAYERREVALGAEEDGIVEVRRGLRAGEPVVAAGAVYLDQRAQR